MKLKEKYIVASRPSLLATTQTEQTLDLIRQKYPNIIFEVRTFSTHGDKVTNKPLTEFGGTGVFVKELEQAMERGEADFAVHSLKDVPGEQPAGFTLASFPEREDPRDVVLTRNNTPLKDLPGDCVIGTSSPRRLVQIAMIKPDAVFKDIRGNIDTRLKKLDEGEFDAIVLAAAGLKRLGKHVDECSVLPVESCVPAIGQGIIGIECRSDDSDTAEMLRVINHAETEKAALAERAFMRTIGGGCKFPLAAHAVISGRQLILKAMLGNHITRDLFFMDLTGESAYPELIGENLARSVIAEAGRLGIKIGF